MTSVEIGLLRAYDEQIHKSFVNYIHFVEFRRVSYLGGTSPNFPLSDKFGSSTKFPRTVTLFSLGTDLAWATFIYF